MYTTTANARTANDETATIGAESPVLGLTFAVAVAATVALGAKVAFGVAVAFAVTFGVAVGFVVATLGDLN